MKKYFEFVLYLLLMVIVLSSCTSKRKLTYFQNTGKGADSIPFFNHNIGNYVLGFGDIVGVELKGTLPEGFSFFNFRTDWKDPYTEASIFANNFSIDELGNIKLPSIGELKVVGLTIMEANDLVQRSVNEHFTNVQAYVKLFSFDISVLGEVNKPGKITVYQSNSNLMQVLANAGDLTDYGNRRKVRIVRKKKHGVVTEFIDLTDEQIIESEYFFLKPGDIIYVPPVSLKTLELNLSPWKGLLSAVVTSSVILIRIFSNSF